MRIVMSIWCALFLLTLTTAQHIPLHYHHDIFYPGSESGELFASSDARIVSAPLRGAVFSAGFPAAAGNYYYDQRPLAASINLFTPNTVQQPAETPGQIENYRKALEEEAQEAEKAENAVINNSGPSYAIGTKSYVSVRIHDGPNQYGYTA